MAIVHTVTPEQLRRLESPGRNNFFYGKLMSVLHFQMEQTYFNRKRWLLNRLAVGNGVLCGLEVVVAENGQRVWIKPGVALDPLGREIIVAGGYCVENPRQPTDECGRPEGDPIAAEGTVSLLLCYHECATEPVPVLVAECDTRQDCAPSTIRERFSVRVVTGAPASKPAGLTPEQCAAIFPDVISQDFDRRVAACGALTGTCAEPTDDCVVLATVALPADPQAAVTVDECAYRLDVYSNAQLFDMLLCLSDRVDDCCGRRQLLLQYVSGDAQQASPGAALSDPLVVQVVDAGGNPVANETVTFQVRGGGGTLAPTTAPSGTDGRAATNWTVGPTAGLNTMAASIAGVSELPMFALAVPPPPVVRPPVVMHIWPDNAMRINNDDPHIFQDWRSRPQIAITFDREMRRDQLEDPTLLHEWLRVDQLRNRDRILGRPVELRLADLTDTFRDRTGFTAVYDLHIAEPTEPARFLVQMRANAANITDVGTPPQTLDAEFVGTRLAQQNLTRIWNLTTEEVLPSTAWTGLVDTGATLPRSGDGNEGGNFASWFEVGQPQ